MNDLINIYRDPLFGLSILVAIIAVVILADYYKNKQRNKQREKSLRNIVKAYQHNGFEDGVSEFLKVSDNPLPTLMFLAQNYSRSGDTQQAIKIYLTLLENIPSGQKMEVLEALGIVYFDGGFLLRAKDIFLEILKNFPRNKSVLLYLMQVYEMLGEYENAIDALETLGEVDSRFYCDDVFALSMDYLKVLKIINDPLIPLTDRNNMLLEYKNVGLSRVLLGYFKIHNISIFWSEISNIADMQNYIDLVWDFELTQIPFEDLKHNKTIVDICRAKGYISDGVECDNFELEILRVLNLNSNKKATLGFEYVCPKCKSKFPFDNFRCPKCKDLGNMDLALKIQRFYSEAGLSLL